MNKWTVSRYEYAPNDYRTQLTVQSGEAWVVCYSINGSGIEPPFRVVAGETQRLGPNELLGIFLTKEDAEAAE